MASLPLQENYRINELVSRGLAGLANDASAFVTEDLLPISGVKGMGASFAVQNDRASTGTIQRAGLASFFGDAGADDAIDRAVGGNFHRSVGFSLSPLEFIARHFDGEAVMALELLKDIQLGTSNEMDVKEAFVGVEMQSLLLALEKYSANIFQTAANFSNTAARSAIWGSASDDPILDIANAVDSVSAYGVPADTCVIPLASAQALRLSPGFREYMATDTDRTAISKSRIAETIIANIDGITKVVFPSAKYNSAKLGQTVSLSNVWNDNVWVGHLGNKGVMLPGNKLTLSPTAVGRVIVQDWLAMEYPEHQTKSLVTQITNRQWIGVINAQLGATITATTT